jgi:hypothetical protein
MSSLAAAAIVVTAPRLLIAADSAAAPPSAPVPSWSDMLTAWGLTANGYVATSYYHSNGYPANVHQFDVQHDTFQLDQAGLQVAYQPKSGFGALVDVIAGEDARILHAAEDGNDSTFDVRQAFVQYASGPLTVIGGKYVTLAGAEAINPTLNTNFSRSLLYFYSQPLTHTGLRATYALSDTFSIIGGVNNGWNTTSTSYGSKTGEAAIAWTPNKVFSLTTQAYFGKFSPSLDAERTLVDVVATWNATSALAVIVNFDYGKQDAAASTEGGTWNGTALYLNYAFNDQWRVSLRAEYLDDKDGYLTGTTGQTLKEGTVTFGYAPVKSFELRMEARYDKAQTDLFQRTVAVGPAAATFADSLSELALQGVYKFGT